MERHQILELMGDLKLAGMRHAYDEVIADAIKRQYPAQHVVGDLLQAEIADKHARSIKYQMPIAKPPLDQEIAAFEFAVTPTNEALEIGTPPLTGSRCQLVYNPGGDDTQ